MRAIDNVETALKSQGNTADPSLFVPECYEDLVEIYGSQNINSFAGLMEIIGAYIPTNTAGFFHEEAGWAISAFTTSTTVAGAPDTAITITITSGTGNYQEAGTLSAPRLHDKVIVNGKEAQVTAMNKTVANAHTVDLTPWVLGDSLSVTSGDTIMILGYEQIDGGDINGSVSNYTTKVSNNVIPIVDSFTTTGSAAALDKLAGFMDINGQRTQVEAKRQVVNLFNRFKLKEVQHLLIDVPASNVSITAAGYKGHTGMLPFVEANGTNQGYTTGGLLTTDVALMSYGLKKNRAPLEVMQYESQRFAVDYDNTMKDYFPNGGIQYANFETYGVNKDMAVSLGFRSFRYGQYTFHRNAFDLFDHPESLGYANSKYLNYAFIMPISMVTDHMGNKGPAYRIRYRGNSFVNRKSVFTITGGAAGVPTPTSTKDEINYVYRSEIGSQTMKVNQYGVFIGS